MTNKTNRPMARFRFLLGLAAEARAERLSSAGTLERRLMAEAALVGVSAVEVASKLSMSVLREERALRSARRAA